MKSKITMITIKKLRTRTNIFLNNSLDPGTCDSFYKFGYDFNK